jgi:hypothetical protein
MNPKALASIVGVGLVGLSGLGTAKSDKPEKADRPHLGERMRGPGPGPSGSASAGPRHIHGDWAEDFRKRRPTPKELMERLAEIKASAGARRSAHMAEVRARFGAALGRREVMEELRRHARRVAFLNRAKFIATTEFDEPRRTTALARIDKLMTKEKARHERRVEKLKSNAPSPGPSGSASAGPTPTTSAAPPAPAGSVK